MNAPKLAIFPADPRRDAWPVRARDGAPFVLIASPYGAIREVETTPADLALRDLAALRYLKLRKSKYS